MKHRYLLFIMFTIVFCLISIISVKENIIASEGKKTLISTESYILTGTGNKSINLTKKGVINQNGKAFTDGQTTDYPFTLSEKSLVFVMMNYEPRYNNLLIITNDQFEVVYSNGDSLNQRRTYAVIELDEGSYNLAFLFGNHSDSSGNSIGIDYHIYIRVLDFKKNVQEILVDSTSFKGSLLSKNDEDFLTYKFTLNKKSTVNYNVNCMTDEYCFTLIKDGKVVDIASYGTYELEKGDYYVFVSGKYKDGLSFEISKQEESKAELINLTKMQRMKCEGTVVHRNSKQVYPFKVSKKAKVFISGSIDHNIESSAVIKILDKKAKVVYQKTTDIDMPDFYKALSLKKGSYTLEVVTDDISADIGYDINLYLAKQKITTKVCLSDELNTYGIDCIWSSSNNRTIDLGDKNDFCDKVIFTAKKKGKAIVTGITREGKKISFTITVKDNDFLSDGYIEEEYEGYTVYYEIANPSEKKIKYIDMTGQFYNRVNDVIKYTPGKNNEYSVRVTGPIEPSGLEQVVSSPYIYDSTLSYLKITIVKVTFMDGTVKTVKTNKKLYLQK